jgi:hypothetical protein
MKFYQTNFPWRIILNSKYGKPLKLSFYKSDTTYLDFLEESFEATIDWEKPVQVLPRLDL